MLGKNVFGHILDSGFNFDFIDDEAIDLVGIPYGAIVLPGVERIPLLTYQKIREYALQGGVVVATRPTPHLAPGLLEGRRDSARVQAISQELFEGQNAKGFFIESESQLGQALAKRLIPDVELNPKVSEIGFVRRKLGSGDLYFLANTSNQEHDMEATFRVKNVSPERWDPFTAKKSSRAMEDARDGRIVVRLRLEPYESAVLMFSHTPLMRAAPARPEETSNRTPMDLSRRLES